jgi:hypothetical protein
MPTEAASSRFKTLPPPGLRRPPPGPLGSRFADPSLSKRLTDRHRATKRNSIGVKPIGPLIEIIPLRPASADRSEARSHPKEGIEPLRRTAGTRSRVG